VVLLSVLQILDLIILYTVNIVLGLRNQLALRIEGQRPSDKKERRCLLHIEDSFVDEFRIAVILSEFIMYRLNCPSSSSAYLELRALVFQVFFAISSCSKSQLYNWKI